MGLLLSECWPVQNLCAVRGHRHTANHRFDSAGKSLDNISPRVEHMINTQYQELPFPEDNENFSKKVALYVRKPDVLELDVHGAPILPLLELVKKQEEGTGDLV